MEFNDLTPELKERARACKTTEELVALAHSEGIELSDEQLEAFSGGGIWDDCSGLSSDCNCYSDCYTDCVAIKFV